MTAIKDLSHGFGHIVESDVDPDQRQDQAVLKVAGEGDADCFSYLEVQLKSQGGTNGDP